MIRWLRVVLPSLGWLGMFLLAYGSAVTFAWWFESRAGRPLREAHSLTGGILGLGAIAYGAWRGQMYHPVYRPAYKSWLETTPWTSRQPLPLGPVQLAAQDFVILGFVVLFTQARDEAWGIYVLQYFLALYLAGITPALFATGVWPWAYAVAFGLGAAVWLWRDVPGGLLAALVTYAVAHIGVQRSLDSFPWDIDWQRRLAMMGIQIPAERGAAEVLGWPFGRLAPRGATMQVGVPLVHAALGSLLAGWWTFAVASLLPLPEFGFVLGMALLVAGALVPMVRVGHYCDGHAPPISVLGRITTGRLIIPDYDKVFAAPALAIALAVVLAVVTIRFGLDPLPIFPPAIALLLFISLGAGPSLVAWRLTGNHRIVEGSQKAAAVRVG
jgi:hypothetical protein